ncbi:hypothetical protein FAUST_3469 [Fusarium austroamericanum]|uniref:Heterokaryon incompatibility domain-containing protein n=1 Tax=Fusarium austroamericanum TaxID=282268 RepID=A0AAN6HHN8_FUSAU|nr:hypothetical protein FAUST_3469 [Fusarium austroamericanum]
MAQRVGHQPPGKRNWNTTPLDADYMVDTNNTGWVNRNLAEIRLDGLAAGHKLRPSTKSTVKLAEGKYMTGIEDGVTRRHRFLYSEDDRSQETRAWHLAESLTISEHASGTYTVALKGEQEFSWDFRKEEGFFFVPDELLQVVEVADMCTVEAYGKSIFSGKTLPDSFKQLKGKMTKVWATSNVVPGDLYGCYDEHSDPFLLNAFGLVRYRACEVSDPVGWDVDQTPVVICNDTSIGRLALLDGHPTWNFPAVHYSPCPCLKAQDLCGKEISDCTSGKFVYDHGLRAIRRMQEGESYVALSYVWTEFQANGLMQHALERVCAATNMVVFWIDQYCINQQCNNHKSEQVPRMGEIYSNATNVACLLPTVDRVLPANVRNRTMVMRRDEFSEATATFRAQIKASRWFTRVWTWQEGLLARKSMFVTSNDVLDGWLVDNILNATRVSRCSYVSHLPAVPTTSNVQSLSLALSSDTQLLYQRTADDAASRELRQYWGTSKSFSLMGAVIATRRRSAGRKLDEVFGLLGMVEGGERMPVSYNDNTMENVLTEALRNGLMTTELLSGVTVSSTQGQGWMPVLFNSSHIGLQLSRLNRAGRNITANKDGMAVLTGKALPKGCKWTTSPDSRSDAEFKLKSEDGRLLASSNNAELAEHLERPMVVVLLDDVLSGDCYGTFAMMEETSEIAMRRITSSRIRLHSFDMQQGTYIVG